MANEAYWYSSIPGVRRSLARIGRTRIYVPLPFHSPFPYSPKLPRTHHTPATYVLLQMETLMCPERWRTPLVEETHVRGKET